MTADIFSARCERRKLEKLYKRTHLIVHKEMYVSQLHAVNYLVKEAKKAFFAGRLTSGGSQFELFRTFQLLTSTTRCVSLPSGIPSDKLSEKFASYFEDKISAIRGKLDSCVTNNCSPADLY